MTEAHGKQLLILAARADHLANLRDRNRISEEQYYAMLNNLRGQAGLEPLYPNPHTMPQSIASAAWGA